MTIVEKLLKEIDGIKIDGSTCERDCIPKYGECIEDCEYIALVKAKEIVKKYLSEFAIDISYSGKCSECSRRKFYLTGYRDAQRELESAEPASREFLQECREAAEKYKKEEDRWVSANERMPKTPKENPEFCGKKIKPYLVSIKSLSYPIHAFWDGESFTDGRSKIEITAWMDLPKKHKVSSESSEGRRMREREEFFKGR